MNTTKRKLTTLGEFKDKHYGPLGTEKRENLEFGYEDFKIGTLVQEARKERGLTQQELADKIGTTKSYISKIENNIKEVRLSTLQKIAEIGLEAKLELSINLNVVHKANTSKLV